MKVWIIALYASRILGDGLSTCVALHRGATEQNPIMPSNCSATLSIQTGASVAQGWAIGKLDREGSHRTARWLAGAIIAGETAIAVHNWQVARGLDRR